MMFAYIKGILTTVYPTYVVIDVNGVGYAVFISCRLLGELPDIHQAIQLFTTFVVRESSQSLYGFLESQERDAFEILMNVAGVGPKLALSLIGHLTFSELQVAVSSQDIATLCRVPGVGKKTAERLIVELKDKFPGLWPFEAAEVATSGGAIAQHSQYAQDAVLALINLGYSQSIAQKAIRQSLKQLSEPLDLALLITTALKKI